MFAGVSIPGLSVGILSCRGIVRGYLYQGSLCRGIFTRFIFAGAFWKANREFFTLIHLQ